MPQITAKIKLINGRRISDKNISQISATYKNKKWVAKKETAGYIFRNAATNEGINGHHASLRELIIRTLVSENDYIININ